MNNRKNVQMAQTAILTAIILVMASTPPDCLRINSPEFLIAFPIITMAAITGSGAGVISGSISGNTDISSYYGGNRLGSVFLSVCPFFQFLICVPFRILTGVFYRPYKKPGKAHTVCYMQAA